MNILQYLAMLIQTGLGNLAAYLAAHVLLCLLPAFFIAGAMMALIPQEAVTRYLGREAPKWVSYPASLLAGFVLAVCSCTILPLFSSIYKKGAGLGPALTFMFFAPASNILAILFTGVQIGMDIALARILLCMLFGVSIGLIMSWFFRAEDVAHAAATNGTAAWGEGARVPHRIWVFFGLLVAVLIAGTLQVGLFKNSYITFHLPGTWAGQFQAWLDRVVPPNPALGIEGVSVQGVFLIGLLFVIGATAWVGLGKVDEGFNRWTFVALGVISLTLLVAAFKVVAGDAGFTVGITGKLVAEIVLIGAIWWMALKKMEAYEVQEWLWEMWRFVRQIIPLLLIGVFLAGIARAIIPTAWIKAVAGRNTILGNLLPVIFAVFIYFPTLVEVPVAQTFLSLGMHRGPLLAYLLADPELSLQSILVTQKIIGKKKTAVYVGLVAVFSTLAGLIFGAWVQ
ncbi:MAG TPA: permease [Anaerolineae bacterium]|nr:permease [Anaerolineae bacterium]HQH37840.1 permease [Anaerolineae bacterium]